MPKTKVRPDGQMKIPSSLAKKYRLQEGDTLDVRDLGGGIIFIPDKLEDKELLLELIEHLQDKLEDYLEVQYSKLKKQIEENYQSSLRGEGRDFDEFLAELKEEINTQEKKK